ncbi:MAG TPA: metalloregulator ArsR/SmtB family transcription factor [Ktedonobacterales bacterium]|nr:metalloregulator ArsR/SmtB family transcription factor [Ktedonobacterales bacterium]
MSYAPEPISEAEYRKLKYALKALGDAARLHMVHILASCDEMIVTDLTEALLRDGRLISQPLVSWHLSKLRKEGLVRTRRYGRQVYCTLDRKRYEQCLRMLEQLVAPPGTPSDSYPEAKADVVAPHQRI